MKTLILKLGATGDVVRTTPLLRRLDGEVTWIVTARNRALLEGLQDAPPGFRVLAWDDRRVIAGASFDLVISLEDDVGTAEVLKTVCAKRLFGAYANRHGRMSYTKDARRWFDLSLISEHGRGRADVLKFENRLSYQELIFEGLGFEFSGAGYLLPPTAESDLRGDVAIASEVGSVWPMKKWADFEWLKGELERRKLTVNYLPTRPTLVQHLADVRAHRCLVGGDSLPMHLALGSGIPTVAIFNCTSPWEIHDYGILTKLVSPLLGEFFYKRGFDPRATSAVSRESVLDATLKTVNSERAVRVNSGI